MWNFQLSTYIVLNGLLYKTTLWISMYFKNTSIIVVESELNFLLILWMKTNKVLKYYLIKNNTVVRSWHWRLSEVKTVVQIGKLCNKKFKLILEKIKIRLQHTTAIFWSVNFFFIKLTWTFCQGELTRGQRTLMVTGVFKYYSP